MADQPQWKEPVILKPADLKKAEVEHSEKPHAQEIPVEQIVLVANKTTEPVEKMGAVRKPSRWKRFFTGSVATLLGTAVIGEIYRLISWGFGIHPILGVAFSGLVGIIFVGGILWLWQGMRGLRQLKIAEKLHQEAANLQDQKTHGQAAVLLKKLDHYYDNTPLTESFKTAIRQVDSAYNDGEIIRYVSHHALQAQDEAARQCLHRHSIQSGVMVALSPYATFDMWLVGWRNLKMLREIADIYGISPGTATQWKLLRKVLHNIAFAGLSEISIHAGSHLLSSSLTASLSARAGQGVGAGLFTARSGLQAIKLCRPLPVDEDNQRQLTSVTQSILGAIKST